MKSKSLIYGLLISLIFVLLSGCGINKIVPGLIDSDKKETTDIVRTDANAEEQTTSETTEITTTDNISQTEPEKPKIDYTKIYTEVLDSYYNLILSGSEDYQIGDGKMGLLEAISFMETNDALASVGYAIQDISEDGIPELLIVAIAEKGQFAGRIRRCEYCTQQNRDSSLDCSVETGCSTADVVNHTGYNSC